MKLCYTNENNPGTLKVLIASKCGRNPVHVEPVTAKEHKPTGIKRLPLLELDNGTKIFSSTAASRYLFKPNDSLCEKVDVWLEWESSVLQPALAASNFDKIGDSSVIDLVNYVDKAVEKSQFLVNDEFTVADVVVWSSLYPLVTEQNIVSQYLSSKHSILKWFNTIKDLEPVKQSIAVWGTTAGSAVFKSFLESSWYPSTSTVSVDSKSEEKCEISEEDIQKAKEAWFSDKPRPKPKQNTKPVLPQVGEKNVFVTSALPYVNNVPHLGNIIGCVLSADVFARYCRLRNWNTLYIAGTDEYGTATETKALEENLTPQQICDKYFEIHKETYSWFNIDFDYFGRTTTEQQKIIAQDLFLRVHRKGYTSIESMEQLYCESCDKFLADRFVEGTCPKCGYEDARGDQCDGCGHLMNTVELIKPRCKICGKTPIVKSSDQLFLELPKIEPILREWVNKTSQNWTHNAREITNAWLKAGLKPRCITRDLKWGIPVPLPGFDKKVFYVWFDAPIGYMSITANYTNEWKKWWQPAKETPITYYQFMAKDNVPFHSVMFPATLLAINENYLLVDNIMATEYLNYEDGKFSKSRGIGVFGTDAKTTGIPPDVFRFYLLYMRPETHDSSFNWIEFAGRNNFELLNNLGNFVNRALAFDEKFFDSVIPKMTLTEEDFVFLATVTHELRCYNTALERGKLRDGIKHILNISRHGNQFMQTYKPWNLIKGGDDEKARAGTVIGLLCNIAGLLTVMVQPYMPSTALIMADQMNASLDIFVLTDEVNILFKEGHKIGKPVPLFSKIETATVEGFKKLFSGRQKSVSPDKDAKPAMPRNADSLKKLEAAIAEQGNLVRQMKSSGKEKSEWLPHVNALLDMKKQYEEMKKALDNAANDGATVMNGDCKDKEAEILRLEDAIKTQGDKIRILKANKEGKDVWGPLVTELIDLKNKLAKLKPNAEIVAAGNKKKKG